MTPKDSAVAQIRMLAKRNVRKKFPLRTLQCSTQNTCGPVCSPTKTCPRRNNPLEGAFVFRHNALVDAASYAKIALTCAGYDPHCHAFVCDGAVASVVRTNRQTRLAHHRKIF